MKIGILGGGQVGQTLGAPLLKSGHAVKYASRNPAQQNVQEILKKQEGATAGTWSETVEWANALLLTVPGMREKAEYEALAGQLGDAVKGKVIIDATNPLTPYPGLEVLWDGRSGGEMLAAAVPDAFVYKAFNTAGIDVLAHPDGSTIGPGAGPLSMMYAGPAEQQQQQVAEEVIRGVGFRPEYVGPIRYARNLEAIGELWIHTAVPQLGLSPLGWGADFHFQVLRK